MTERITPSQLQAWYEWAKTIIPVTRRQEGLGELHYFLTELTNIDRLSLALGVQQLETPLESPYSLVTLEQMWRTRWQNQMPLPYVLGWCYWRQFKLKVTPAVLIPRPETEYLIDLAQQLTTPSQQQGIWADLGTGSGAIAIGLATVFPQAQIYAVDSSAAALAVAEENIQKTGFRDRIQLVHGSWWQPLAQIQGKIAGVVSNPPYIPQAEIPHLQPEVQAHEPHLALSGGPDGLVAIHTIITAAAQFLRPGGVLLLEIMAGQGVAVKTLMEHCQAFAEIQIFPDLAGLDRYGYAVSQSNPATTPGPLKPTRHHPGPDDTKQKSK